MENKILLALIASITSLIVAVISIIQSKITVKQNLESSKELEELKYNLEVRRKNKNAYEAVLNNRTSGLDKAISEIQKLKDHILIINSASENNLLVEEVYNWLMESRKSLFIYYESYLSNFENNDASFIHKAKNLSLA
jgi:hypothetical protein